MSRGLVINRLAPPICRNTRQFALSAKMWYSGIAVTTISWDSRRLVPSHADACSMFATMFLCVSIAPLATPVVPPVYCRKAMSSWPISIFGSVLMLPRVSASLKRTSWSMRYFGTIFLTWRTTRLVISDFGKPSMSPIAVVTTCLTEGACGSTSASVAAKLSSTTIALAPESFN